MSRKPIRNHEEAKSGNRSWSQTLCEHGVILFLGLLVGPLSLVIGVMYVLAERTDPTTFEHLKVDFLRMGRVWIVNGLLWTVLILVTIGAS